METRFTQQQSRELSEANDDWARANAAANRAFHGMAIIPPWEPLYKELEQELAIAEADRIEAGYRIDAISKSIIEATERASA